MSRPICLVAALLILGPARSLSLARELQDWRNVQNLKAETPVVVTTAKGEKYKGRLAQVTGESLSIRVKHSHGIVTTRELSRTDVLEVSKPLPHWLLGLAGAWGGLAAGAGIGVASDSIAVAFFSLIAGTTGGYFAGSHLNIYRKIYEAVPAAHSGPSMTSEGANHRTLVEGC